MAEYKGYDIVNADGNNCRLKRIKSIGKGSIPMVLTGLYTTEADAMKAIDKQKSSDKVIRNAKKQSNG
jgi:hypothetical protein